ncbi:MAG: diacylglycerol kinase family protein, partial [Ruminococcus sp.]
MKELNSFRCAFRGFFTALKSERHLRFHLIAAVFTLIFAYLGKFEFYEWLALIITICCVIGAELINTAVEALCDLYST